MVTYTMRIHRTERFRDYGALALVRQRVPQYANFHRWMKQ